MAAISKNRVLGKNNELIFRIAEDAARMRRITTGHPIIMGRKTFDSIGRPLPNRTNIVITHDAGYKKEGIIVVGSLEEAIEKAKEAPGNDEIFIFGGGQIYTEALPQVERLYLTVVDKEVEGDAYFPDYSLFTKVIEEEHHEEENLSYTFYILEK